MLILQGLETGSEMAEVVACQTCGLVQRVGRLPKGWAARCARCGFRVLARKSNSRTRTAALALTALILYFPANFFPIVTTQYWGAEEKTTIFDGIRGLFQTGSYVVGSLVFTTSILSPALKILGLLFLSISANSSRLRRVRTCTYKIIQIIDPWNMLEVTLLSMLVAVAELGRIATVHPGAGVFSFGGVVIFTILATLTFDSRLVWDPPRAGSEGSAG
jgi:paraquat-inducible protein A